jgi:DnaJ-class molecular chaperone with C-terminal Zn finger domain
MGDQWDNDSHSTEGGDLPNQDEIEKRLDDLRRVVTQGANEAQTRLKRVFNKANDYWQQTQSAPVPRQPGNVEEQRLRQIINAWSNENWRVARDLGTYMDIVALRTDEVWQIALETRWETRTMEVTSEPYNGHAMARPQPLLPVWDYELPPITGLKSPTARTRLDNMDEIVSCTSCNSTGHVFCSGCNGRGWIVCPDCKGRTKKRCPTCRGRGYVADWSTTQKKPFFQRQASNMAASLGNKVSDVVDSIRQQGVPLPNPLDSDPAAKGTTIPCPDCINGEVDCSCVNGKRVCPTCQGAKMSLCPNCGGTGRVVRHRDIVRSFDLRSQSQVIGTSAIPVAQLARADGDLVYSAEINEPLFAEAAPEQVPQDIWQTTVELVNSERQAAQRPNLDPQATPRPTLQVVELVRIPYTAINYRYADQDYVLYIYDNEGNEKFYAEHAPARWDRVERLVKAITADLTAPTTSDPEQQETTRQNDQPQTNKRTNDRNSNSYSGGYRIPVEVPNYTIIEEEDEEEDTPPTNNNNHQQP